MQETSTTKTCVLSLYLNHHWHNETIRVVEYMQTSPDGMEQDREAFFSSVPGAQSACGQAGPTHRKVKIHFAYIQTRIVPLRP